MIKIKFRIIQDQNIYADEKEEQYADAISGVFRFGNHAGVRENMYELLKEHGLYIVYVEIRKLRNWNTKYDSDFKQSGLKVMQAKLLDADSRINQFSAHQIDYKMPKGIAQLTSGRPSFPNNLNVLFVGEKKEVDEFLQQFNANEYSLK